MRPPKNPVHPGALLLAEALGTSSRLWMNLQATWDLDVAAKRCRHAA